jgi:putative transposase
MALSRLTMLDLFTCDCSDIAVDLDSRRRTLWPCSSGGGSSVAFPQRLYCERRHRAGQCRLDLWAYTNGVILDLSRRGKPTDHTAIESFNGRGAAARFNVARP